MANQRSSNKNNKAKPAKANRPLAVKNSKADQDVSNEAVVFAPEGFANAGQPVNVDRISVYSPEVRTTVGMSGNEIQVGVESSIQDLGFTTPVNMGDRIVDISMANFMRSRDVTFTGKAFMPGARLYPFFDDVDVSAYCKPDGGDYGDPLICNSKGKVTGVFTIPNDAENGVRFKTGTVTFRLSTSPTNQQFPPPASFADAKYHATGWVATKQATTYSTRAFKYDVKSVSKVGNPIETKDSVDAFEGAVPRDPIAQSFFIYDDGGCHVTAVDIFFYKKPEDPNKPQPPIIFQLRALDDGGNPSNKILPFGEVVKDAEEIVVNKIDLQSGKLTVTGNPNGTVGVDTGPWTATSPVTNKSGVTIRDGESVGIYVPGFNPVDHMIPTRFRFESPIPLLQNTSYCFVILSDSNEYNVWVSQSGPDVTGRDGVDAFRSPGETNTNIGTEDAIQKDPYIQGVYFKSQNGISWTADQSIDIKFCIYKAKYDISNTGKIDFVNEELPKRTLTLDPFIVQQGQSIVRVIHPNHGMPIGSKVVFSGVSGGSGGILNGIPLSTLNSISGFTIIQTELDHYVIDVGTPADASGKVGGNSVVATENKRFEELLFLTTPLEFPNTSINWNVRATSSQGVNESIHSPYLVQNRREIAPNDNFLFDKPMHVSSWINENNSSDTPPGPSTVMGLNLGDKKSLQIQAVLSSSNENISPIIDVSRFSVTLTDNRIDNPSGVLSVGSTINPKSVINGVWDNFQCVPTTDQPAVATTAGKIHFSTSTGFLTGTSFTTSGTTITGVGTRFLAELAIGDVVKDPLSGEERTVTSISSNTSMTTDLAFAFNTTDKLLTEPPPLRIKTADENVAIHLSKLDIGKLVSIDAGAGTDRTFTDQYILEVNYTPNNVTPDPDLNNQPMRCEVVIDYRSTAAAGICGNEVSIVQKDRYIDEIAPSGGSCSAKYVSKALSLAQPANTLKVMFDCNRHESNQVDLYYKLSLVDDTTRLDDTNWSLAEYNLEENGGLQPATPLPNDDPEEFSGYEANLLDLPAFNAAQIKIVMRGGNPARVPRIKNLRVIALDE
jgi:hypothetical protein